MSEASCIAYSGSWETAKQMPGHELLYFFRGPVTFKNAQGAQRGACTKFRLTVFLIETDAPYLAPHPHRGKRNESAFVRLVAETAG